jgi:TatD DNase family protein
MMSIANNENFWDAHCHLLDARFDASRDEVLQRARKVKITNFWLGGYSPEDWVKQIQFKQARGPDTQIITSFGLHPWWVCEIAGQKEARDILARALRDLGRALPGADTVGELGLDFHPRRLGSSPESCQRHQELTFQSQLELAHAFKKPIVLHIVRAHREALAILKQHVSRNGRSSGLVHSFTADFQTAVKYLELGLTPSISASAFVDTRAAAQTRLALAKLSLEDFVLETDSPDQGAPFLRESATLNEPSQLYTVAGAVAEIKNTTPQKVLEASRLNLLRILNL